jgi:hypothetical protein
LCSRELCAAKIVLISLGAALLARPGLQARIVANEPPGFVTPETLRELYAYVRLAPDSYGRAAEALRHKGVADLPEGPACWDIKLAADAHGWCRPAVREGPAMQGA